MSLSTDFEQPQFETEVEAASSPTETGPDGTSPTRRIFQRLAFDRFSGLWVLLLLILFYALWEPNNFWTLTNLRITTSGQAITGILTIGLVISLVCGVFDLSVAANMGVALIVVAWLQSQYHWNPFAVVALSICIGGLIGVVNAFIVTVLHVDAVIGTLGMSSILAAMAFWISSGNDITSGLSPGFVSLGNSSPLSIPITVYFLVGVAFLVWYLLEHTPTGRYLYALGFNTEACRLAGVRVVRLQWFGLILSGCLASLAGVLLTMQLGAASYGSGDAYLLPAFATAFLGSTQIKPGRFNIGGTLVALYLLAVGVKGLQLRFSSLPWIADLFEGVALIVAVALARNTAVLKRFFSRRSPKTTG